MAVTFAKLGDTPELITRELLGHYDHDYCMKLWHENANFNCRKLGTTHMFAEGYAVWIPEDNSTMGAEAASAVMPYFDALSHTTLAMLKGLQDIGLAVKHMMLLRNMFQHVQYVSEELKHLFDSLLDDKSAPSQVLGATMSTFEMAADTRKRFSQKGAEKIRDLAQAVNDERSLRLSKHADKIDPELLASKRAARVQAFDDVRHSVSRSVLSEQQASHIFDQPDTFWDQAVLSKSSQRRYWRFHNVFDVEELTSFCEVMENIAKHLLFAEIGIDFIRLIYDFLEGKDWMEDLINDMVDIVLGLLIGLLVAIVFTSFTVEGGLLILVVILGGIVGTGISMAFDYVIDDFIEDKFGKELEAESKVISESTVTHIKHCLMDIKRAV